MKNIIKTIIITFIFICYGNITIYAENEEILESQKESLNLSEFISASQKYTDENLKEMDIQKLLNSAITGKVEDETLIKNAFNIFGNEVKNSLRIMASILVIVLIHSILKSISDSLENESVSQITYYVQYILIATVIMSNFAEVIKMTKETIENMISYIHLLIPLLMTLMMTTGSIISANVLQPVILFIINLISNIFQSIIVPIILVSTALSIISKISDKIQINKIPKFLKSSTVWLIGIMLTIFVGVLSLEGTLSSSVDGITAKTTKAAVSNFIPVVGKILGDAVDTVIGCSTILKNAVGIVGLIVILSICITPIIKLGLITMTYSLTAAICEPIADSKIVNLLEEMGNTFKILLAILCSISVMLIVGITLVLKISNSGLMYR